MTLRAIDELPTLLEVCATTTGEPAVTQAAVAERFQIQDWEAQVMLSMPVIRFTPWAAEILRAELREIDRAIDELQTPGPIGSGPRTA